MRKELMLDEIHLALNVPIGLAAEDYQGMREVVRRRRFTAEIRRAVIGVLRRYSPLRRVRLSISR